MHKFNMKRLAAVAEANLAVSFVARCTDNVIMRGAMLED
jgi:hypothetical protein